MKRGRPLSCSASASSATTKLSAQFKIGFYGPSSVGKTALFARMFTIGDSSCGPEPQTLPDLRLETTIGVDFDFYEYTRNNEHFKLQLWDTAGQERFRSMAAMFLRGCVVIIVTFDLYELYVQLCEKAKHDAAALAAKLRERCDEWFATLRKDSGTQSVTASCANALPPSQSTLPILAVVGNKLDLCKRASNNAAELARLSVAMRRLAEQYAAQYFETSALTGEGVRTLFDWIVEVTHAAYVENQRAIKAEELAKGVAHQQNKPVARSRTVLLTTAGGESMPPVEQDIGCGC